MNFIELYLSGEVLPSDIGNFIDGWHDSDEDNGELHEYLGMTLDEYKLWAVKPTTLPFILSSRKNGTTLEEAIQKMKDYSDKTKEEFSTSLTCEELEALHQDLKDIMYAFRKIESEKPFSDLEYQLENWGSVNE